LMGKAVPDRLGVAVGPGSFTGLRIGLATAKGLAEGWGLELFALDNLKAMASTARTLRPGATAVFPVIDARKKKYYGALNPDTTPLLAADDFSAADWKTKILGVWTGAVLVTGYRPELWAAEVGTLPSDWEVIPLQDWSEGLLNQLATAPKVGLEGGPRYLRLSEAEELLQARTTG